MKAELTKEEASVAIQFLNRVELKGTESEAHALIKGKLMAIRDGRELPDLPEVPKIGKDAG